MHMKNDKERFSAIWRRLNQYYPNANITKSAEDLYFSKLLEYEFETVRDAFIAIVKELKFFPSLAEIINVIERGETRALREWIFVEHAIKKSLWDYRLNFNDPVTHAVILSLGGLYEMAHRHTTLVYLQHDFCERYNALKHARLKDVPVFIEARSPLTPLIFNLKEDGFAKIELFLAQEKEKKLRELQSYYDLLQSKMPSVAQKWEYNEWLGKTHTLLEQIKKLEQEIKGELKCIASEKVIV